MTCFQEHLATADCKHYWDTLWTPVKLRKQSSSCREPSCIQTSFLFTPDLFIPICFSLEESLAKQPFCAKDHWSRWRSVRGSKIMQLYLIVFMISTDSNGIHDVFPSLVFSGGTLRQTVRIMLCSEVMSKFVRRNQVSLLFLKSKNN